VTIRRLTRSTIHREDNDAQVAGYGRALRAVFEDWLRHSQAAGMSTQALGARLQQAAEAHYEPAYLRGKRQAFSAAVLGPDDRQWIAAALQSNRTYVQRSLEGDIQDKATLQRMQGADLAELRKTFASRIELQYGGQLWRVTEAGFRAGVRDLSDTLKARFRLPLRQEDDPRQPDDTDALTALALLLRLGRARVERAVAAAGVTVSDLATATSATTQQVARDLGVTPDALATSAGEAATTAMSGAPSLDAALASSLGVSRAAILDLGLAWARSGDIRMGTAYRTQNDGEVCLPCQSDGAGGEMADGVYWEPDQPPLPGDNCRGRGSCRCFLEAIYDTGSAAAAA
jgi:hypothetical protein